MEVVMVALHTRYKGGKTLTHPKTLVVSYHFHYVIVKTPTVVSGMSKMERVTLTENFETRRYIRQNYGIPILRLGFRFDWVHLSDKFSSGLWCTSNNYLWFGLGSMRSGVRVTVSRSVVD